MTEPMTPEKAQALLDGATPGPWVALTDYWSDGASVLDANGFSHVEISNTGILHEYEKIAPHWGQDDRCHYDIPIETQKANARLIAAAPNLARAYIAQAAELTRLRAKVAELEKAQKP